jgi:hypothetical protein
MKPMQSDMNQFQPRRQRGQTLVVALIIMGLLLIIGFIFVAILNRNIQTAGRMQSRSAENDLSEAGIRYAHSMLLNSEAGADWRGALTYQPSNTVLATRDPDIYYLRPPAFADVNMTIRRNFRPGQPDFGGPDGLGPYTRVNYSRGRVLVRVNYAPSDINIFNSTPTGALRNPGLVRNYLIIESIGRQGAVNTSDPTTLGSGQPVQYAGYGSDAELQSAVAEMGTREKSFGNRAVNRAFASIGIIESARFITNKDHVTRPAELGTSADLGVIYRGEDISASLRQQLGTSSQLYTVGPNPTLTAQSYPGSGSIFSNASLRIHHNLEVNLNPDLGDKIVTSESIIPADPSSSMILNVTRLVNGTWTTTTTTGAVPDSRLAGFSTNGGLVVDGVAEADANGYARGVSAKVPPSIESTDPSTGTSRYVAITRDSGVTYANGNNGALGYGSGVYVANAASRQGPSGERGREITGSQFSLEYDWLNPNNGETDSGWKGFVYAPKGAFVQLISDGFIITRDDDAWHNPDGSTGGSSVMRYRLGYGRDGRIHIVNTNTPGVNINLNVLGRQAFSLGPVFNGVLYFEGNARVRGTIPTDVQLTLVSNATIYIEGSITKGVIGNNLQSDANVGARIPRLSKSMLMLMAKDYVALNTTQFFGPSPSSTLEPAASIANNIGFTPLLMRTGSSLDFQSSLVLNPGNNPTNPSLWRPYAATYTEAGTNNPLTSNMLISHAADDGATGASFLEMKINQGPFDTPNPPAPQLPNPANLPQSSYMFALTASNMMTRLLLPGTPTAYYIYGMGRDEIYHMYPNFETALFPIVDPTTANVADPRLIVANNDNGRYGLFADSINDFDISLSNFGATTSGNYLVGHVAMVPHDIKVEASIFAEEGSFFVIPGQWTNPNPNDRRDLYEAASGTDAEKQLQRLESYGSYPGAPFYGEAPDVRVQIVGAVSENMPPSMDVQSEWVRKWGWIPMDLGASGRRIPSQHVPPTANVNTTTFVPNLSIVYDSVLATARPGGYNNDPLANPILRTDSYGRALPPLPRLPVSPALAFFGDVR